MSPVSTTCAVRARALQPLTIEKKFRYRTKYWRTILQSKKLSLPEIFQRNFGRWCFKYKAWAAEVTGVGQAAADESTRVFQKPAPIADYGSIFLQTYRDFKWEGLSEGHRLAFLDQGSPPGYREQTAEKTYQFKKCIKCVLRFQALQMQM